MAKFLNSEIEILKLREGIEGLMGTVLVRMNQREGLKLDIRIILLGAFGVGKSSLVSYFYSSANPIYDRLVD